MSVPAKKPADDQKLKKDKKIEEPITTTVGSKESPSAEVAEAKLLAEVVERSRESDLDAQKKIEEDIGKEARLSKPDIDIGPDLADHGVKAPDQEASDVIKNGTTLTLPVTEEEYMEDEKVGVNGKTVGTRGNRSYYAFQSVAALVILFGKWIKDAHRKGKEIVFKKGN